MLAILSSMARSSAMRSDVDEDIRAVRAATKLKASPPLVSGSAAMVTTRSRSAREGRYGGSGSRVFQVLQVPCIWGEERGRPGSVAVDEG